MAVLYFAYGSNLCLPRLRSRVPNVALVGRAVLPGHDLRWHKRSIDTSGKCNVIEAPTSIVHGALFEMSPEGKRLLDRAEGRGLGYDDAEVRVEAADGPFRAVTYLADPAYIDETLTPFTWYRDLVISGAEALGFPTDYVSRLRDVDAAPDPDRERDARERRFLGGR